MSYILCLLMMLCGIGGIAGALRRLSEWLHEKDDLLDVIILLSSCVLMPVSASCILWLVMFIFPGVFSLSALGFMVVALYIILVIVFGRSTVDVCKCVWAGYRNFWVKEKCQYASFFCLFAFIAMLTISAFKTRYMM